MIFRSGDSRLPSYIQSAYAWLLDNLHNPYPSRQIKESIAQTSGSSVKHIDGWFTDIRKRMGWSKMKRVYFQNRRKPLVDAATSFFREKGNISLELMHELTAMEVSAKGLYAGKFFESGMLSKVVPRRSEQRAHQPQPVWSYPSPCQSPERVSPVLRRVESPTACRVSENVSQVKRKRSRSEDAFSSCSVPSRSSKRVRWAKLLEDYCPSHPRQGWNYGPHFWRRDTISHTIPPGCFADSWSKNVTTVFRFMRSATNLWFD